MGVHVAADGGQRGAGDDAAEGVAEEGQPVGAGQGSGRGDNVPGEPGRQRRDALVGEAGVGAGDEEGAGHLAAAVAGVTPQGRRLAPLHRRFRQACLSKPDAQGTHKAAKVAAAAVHAVGLRRGRHEAGDGAAPLLRALNTHKYVENRESSGLAAGRSHLGAARRLGADESATL